MAGTTKPDDVDRECATAATAAERAICTGVVGVLDDDEEFGGFSFALSNSRAAASAVSSSLIDWANFLAFLKHFLATATDAAATVEEFDGIFSTASPPDDAAVAATQRPTIRQPRATLRQHNPAKATHLCECM